MVGETVRRENALDFGWCNSRPQTVSLHPMAIEVGCFSVTKRTQVSGGFPCGQPGGIEVPLPGVLSKLLMATVGVYK